jgi:glycosyltransferase involved in cell wall biosynthesis
LKLAVPKKRLLMLGTHYDTMGGISSVVNVYREHGLFEKLSITYIPTHCNGSAAAKLKLMASAYLCFAGRVLTGQVGAVHAHVASRASFWRKAPLLWMAQRWGIPTIVHLHGAEFHLFYEKECKPWQQRLVRHVFENARAAIALSNTWAEWMRQHFPHAQPVVIANPIRIPEPAPLWSQRQAGAILSLGELGKRKGTYDLLEAIAHIPPEQRHHTHVQLRLGGNGEVAQTQTRAKELGIDNHVKLLGWVRGEDKSRELAKAWVYTLPSYNEGLPMSLLEAMAAGLPVVTTPIGGIPEAVTDGVEGFLIDAGDVSSLCERLQRLCSDPALAQRMGQAARLRAQRDYSIDAIAPQLQALYANIGWKPHPQPPKDSKHP